MNTLPLCRQDVIDAHHRIRSLVQKTPVFTSRLLNEFYGAELFFKGEHVQSSGAFKFRGASNVIALLTEEERQRGVVTHSSGNHAQALALAAARAGVKATIVMPLGSNPLKKTATEGYGAKVVECENNQPAREAMAALEIEKTGGTLVHPYDDPRIIAGAGTAALELVEEIPNLDAIIAPVGGGGLLSGTALAAQGICPVYGAEPLGANDAFLGFTRGERIVTQTPDTVCDGLRTCLGVLNFEIILALVKGIGVASDPEVLSAQWQILTRTKQVIESSSAVPLACLANGSLRLSGKIGIIISGGNLDMGPLLCPSD